MFLPQLWPIDWGSHGRLFGGGAKREKFHRDTGFETGECFLLRTKLNTYLTLPIASNLFRAQFDNGSAPHEIEGES